MYHYFTKKALLASVSIIFFGSTHSLAIAQTNSESAQNTENKGSYNSQIDELIVTARKVQESAQDVPISMSTLNSDQLKNRNVEDISDIQYQVPSLVFSKTATSSFTPLVALRGQTQTTTSLTVDPSVGVYFDGVYVSGTGGLTGSSLEDIERIEVLKGPQGTLFGRNTTGGAVSVISKLPTDEFEGEISTRFGNYNTVGINAISNIPLIEDKLALRIVGGYSERDGYGYDNARDVRVGDQIMRSGRATLRYTPNQNFESIFRADFTDGDDNGLLLFPVYQDPNIAIATFSDASITLTGENTANGRALANDYFQGLANADPFNVRYNTDTFNRVNLENYSLTMRQDFGNYEIKSITAYRQSEDERNYEVDASDIANLSSLTTVDRDLFTQELLLSGEALANNLSYTLGGYYYNLDGTEVGATSQFANLTNGRVTTNSVDFKGESVAAFGQATYAVTSALDITGGLRYTWEEKTYNNFSGQVSDSNPVSNCLLPPALNSDLSNCSLVRSNSEDNVSYTAAIDYTLSNDFLLYARTARGYKSGGFNQRVTGDNPLSGSAYFPEKITDYELGFKSDWYDNRLRLNLAYYHSLYKNIQRQSAACDSIGQGCTTVLRNAAEATIDGVEAEFTAIPVEGLLLSATSAYTNPEYTSFVVNGIDNSDERFLEIPEWTYSLSAAFTQPVTWGELFFQIDWAWRSDSDMAPQDYPGGLRTSGGIVSADGPGTPDQFRVQPSYGLLNGTIAFRLDKPDAEIRFFAKNILDKRYFSHMIGNVNAGLGLSGVTVGAPATYGLEFAYRY